MLRVCCLGEGLLHTPSPSLWGHPCCNHAACLMSALASGLQYSSDKVWILENHMRTMCAERNHWKKPSSQHLQKDPTRSGFQCFLHSMQHWCVTKKKNKTKTKNKNKTFVNTDGCSCKDSLTFSFFFGGGGSHLVGLRAYSLLCSGVTPGDRVGCWGINPVGHTQDKCPAWLHFHTEILSSYKVLSSKLKKKKNRKWFLENIFLSIENEMQIISF